MRLGGRERRVEGGRESNDGPKMFFVETGRRRQDWHQFVPSIFSVPELG